MVEGEIIDTWHRLIEEHKESVRKKVEGILKDLYENKLDFCSAWKGRKIGFLASKWKI